MALLLQHPAIDALRDPVVLLRAFYLAASLLILVIQAIPALRNRFLAYGSRATTAAKGTDTRSNEQSSPFTKLLDYAAAIQVPHNWFTHFYILSVTYSLFWGWKLRLWDASVVGTHQRSIWALMLVQGVRRMIESYHYTSASQSRMWFAHWILGLLFYLTINVAVWIERPDRPIPWYISCTTVPAVLFAHVMQHFSHAYFFNLRAQNKGYQLPECSFGDVLCPHYFWEVMIYFCLSLFAAPHGGMINWTLACATIFVATNLGVTAVGTKQWYMEKFGKDRVGPMKRMVPYLW